MKNSADIRKENKKRIYRFMLNGQQYTKQQVALNTGLSVATCNTLLNEMQVKGIVSGETKKLGEVGRSSVLYQINDEHESYLTACFYIVHEKRYVEYTIFSALGRVLYQSEEEYKFLSYELLEESIAGIIREYANVSQIIIGTPSITEQGVLKYSDIPELENVHMEEKLLEKFNIGVSIENDMHCMAYGYCKKTCAEDEVISLAYYPSGVLPGTVTIHKGTIIKGANGIAGMAGFLPYDINREKQSEIFKSDKCIPFVAVSLCSIIALLNPSKVVLSGDLINEKMMETVRKICEENIPKEYFPKMVIKDSFKEYFYEGMYQIAVEKKEI